jgi:Bacterial capsule synthesis protein PGA_cap
MLLPDPPARPPRSARPPTRATYYRRRAVAVGALVLVVLAVAGLASSLGAGARTAQAVAPHRAITIAWVGDITPGSALGVPPGDGRAQFAGVRRRLHAADLTFGNLEGTYSVGGDSKCAGGEPGHTCFAFQAPPDHAAALRWAGFDAVNLANNHAWDFGAGGQAQTTAALRRAGVAATGRPGEITVLRRNGVKVALLGFAAYPWAASLADLDTVRALVRRATTRAALVVVAMHAGAEGADQAHVPKGAEQAFGENRGDSRTFAHTAIDAGADLVVGSGPHVIRGLERYHHRLIAYSLGNFTGWNNFGLGGNLSESGILKTTLSPTGAPTTTKWIPIHLTGPGIPTPERSGASRKLAEKLSRQDFGKATGMIKSPDARRPTPEAQALTPDA